jgi:hypothetical protein
LGQVIQNVFHIDDPGGSRTHEAIKDYMIVKFINVVKAAQVSAFTWEVCEVRQVGAGGQPVTSFALGVIAGTHGGAGILNVGAFIIQKRSGLSGRHNRGRFYLGGPRADWTSNNLINAAGVAGMAPILSNIKTGFITGGVGNDMRMKILGKAPGSVPVALTDFVLAPGIGIQRRRNINVGI